MGFVVCIEDGQVGDTFEIGFRRRFVGDFEIAFEIPGGAFRSGSALTYCHSRVNEAKDE